MIFFLVSLALWARASGLSSGADRRAPAAKLGLHGAGNSSSAPFRQKLGNRADVQYIARITLGGQEVDAIFDTGSFDVLVVSQKCDQCPNPQYNSSRSKTFHSLDTEANHSFGSG